MDFSNLVVKIKFSKQNIGNIFFLDHLMRQIIINIYFTSYGGPKIKVFFSKFPNSKWSFVNSKLLKSLKLIKYMILFVVKYVNCSDGEKNLLWKFFISTLYLVPTRLKMLFFKKLSKLIVFIFRLFQSLELIKYVLKVMDYKSMIFTMVKFILFFHEILYYYVKVWIIIVHTYVIFK